MQPGCKTERSGRRIAFPFVARSFARRPSREALDPFRTSAAASLSSPARARERSRECVPGGRRARATPPPRHRPPETSPATRQSRPGAPAPRRERRGHRPRRSAGPGRAAAPVPTQWVSSVESLEISAAAARAAVAPGRALEVGEQHERACRTDRWSRPACRRARARCAARASPAGRASGADRRGPCPRRSRRRWRTSVEVAELDVEIVRQRLEVLGAEIGRGARDVARVGLLDREFARPACAPPRRSRAAPGPATPLSTSASFQARLCAS